MSVIIIVAAVISLVTKTVESVISGWNAIFPERSTLQLVDLTAVNNADSIAAFRRMWLGETVVPPPITRPAPRSSISSIDSVNHLSPNEVRLIGPPKVIFLAIPRPSGRFPIIDIKLRNTAGTAAFLSGIEIMEERRGRFEPLNGACMSTGPSWEYDLLINPAKDSATLRLDISQTVPASGVDRFIVVVGQEGNAVESEYRLGMTLLYNGGKRLPLGTVTLKVGSSGCADVYHLPTIRHLPVSSATK